MAKLRKQKKLQDFWKLASVCKTEEDKVNFWDLYQGAFELNPETKEELRSSKVYFESEWGIDLDEYEKKHSDYPNAFKVISVPIPAGSPNVKAIIGEVPIF